MATISVVTKSGSIYTVIERDNGCFLQGDHAPTASSTDIRGKEWEIIKPDAPEIGKSWVLISYHILNFTHPDRMPGGGKQTSPVVDIRVEE